MVLVVVGEESDEIVAEGHPRLQHGGVPRDHRVVVGGPENDVRKLLRGDPLRRRRESPGGSGHGAHRVLPMWGGSPIVSRSSYAAGARAPRKPRSAGPRC